MEDNEKEVNEKVNELISILLDKNKPESVRAEAANALGKIDYSNDPELRKKAIEVLKVVLIGNKETPKDESSWVRENAAWALGKIGAKEAVGPLIKALGDKNELVRANAAEALGNINYLDAPELRNKAVEALEVVLTGDKKGSVRVEAAEALWNIDYSNASELRKKAVAVDVLIKALEDKDEDVCKSAIWVLGINYSNDPELRNKAVEALIKALKDENLWVRIEAAWTLGEINYLDAPELRKKVVEALRVVLIRDKKGVVREEAAKALGKIDYSYAPELRKKVVEALIGALRDKDEDLRVRIEAARALMKINYSDTPKLRKKVVEALIGALRDDEGLVRRNAAEALENITSELKEIKISRGSKRILINALGSKEEKVQEIAEKLLLKSDSIGILLRHEYGNPNEKIRRHCAEISTKILAREGIEKDFYKMPFRYKLNVGAGVMAGIVKEVVRAPFGKMRQMV